MGAKADSVGINLPQLWTWLVGIGIVAAITAGGIAYSSMSKAESAEKTAEKAEETNHAQDLKIQALEMTQKQIAEDTADTKAATARMSKQMDRLLRSRGLDPEGD